MAAKKTSRVDAICDYVKPRNKTWFDHIPEVDQQDLLAIRRKVQAQGLSRTIIAKRMVLEFVLTTKVPTLLKWLAETDE